MTVALTTMPGQTEHIIEMPIESRPPREGSSLQALDLEPLAAPGQKGITRLTVKIPTPFTSAPVGDVKRPPPRWKTPEFIFYVLALFVAVPWMVKVPVSLSQRKFPLCIQNSPILIPSYSISS